MAGASAPAPPTVIFSVSPGVSVNVAVTRPPLPPSLLALAPPRAPATLNVALVTPVGTTQS